MDRDEESIEVPSGSIAELAEEVLGGRLLSRDQAEILAALAQSDLPELLYWSSQIRLRFFGRRVRLCSIVPGKLGGCGEDCAWCGQAARNHRGEAKPARRTRTDEVLSAARNARQWGASCFCVVNSGRRPSEQDVAFLENCNKELSAAGLVPACASMGQLDDITARRLVAAGVVRYNHNIETSHSHFGRVVTTHSYEDRLATLRAARSAGMALCCGGIFGIGEAWADRIELALTLRDQVKPDVVPLNFLDARPGTPLADAQPLTPLKCLHIIAVFRFLLPTTNIKIAGGRRLLRDLQSWVFHAGATSLMVGDYLTTNGRSVEQDRQMVLDLGLEMAERHGDGKGNEGQQTQ